jgi:hypothetical protein
LRATITIGCGLVGTVLVGLSFLNPPVTAASRPTVLGAGLVLLVLGSLLATIRTLRRRPRREVSADVQETERDAPAAMIVREPAPPVALPKADVSLRVAGNGAAERWVRWYHVAAATLTDVAARHAKATVAVRGEQVDAEPWRWADNERALDLTQAGARIPLVIGGVVDPAQPLANGWTVPFRNWYLTPSANGSLGRFLAPFIAGFRHVFEVTVTWTEGGTEQRSSAAFELRFWREPTSEPRFLRVGDRPSYHDQAGGLAEQRDKGVALRKEGMLLPPASLPVWLGRVDRWTSETRELITEVSTADSDYFWNLSSFTAPLFEGVRIHDDRHRRSLQGLHERLIRLQNFVRVPVA